MNVLTASMFMALVMVAVADESSVPKLAGVVEAIKDEAKVPLLNKKIYIEKPIIEEVPKDSIIDPSEVQKAIPVQQKEDQKFDNMKLAPIPIMFPSMFQPSMSRFPSALPPFIQSILNEIPMIEQQAEKQISKDHDQQQRHFMSIVMLKQHKTPEEELNSQAPSEIMPIRKNFLIMKIMPKHKIFGGDSDPDHQKLDADDENPTKTRIHLLGGPSDPDNSRNNFFGPPRRVHLYGGPSESDRVHGTGYMTGNEQGVINALQKQDMEQEDDESTTKHHIFFDHIRKLFGEIGNEEDNKEQEKYHYTFFDKIKHFFNSDEEKHDQLDRVPPFMIRGEPFNMHQNEPPKRKCHIFGFMRLHASHYYQILIHFLFLSGLVLIALLVCMTCMRAYRRKRAATYRHFTQHDMHISSIDAQGKLKKETKKTSDFLVQDSQAVSHPAPPPAYADSAVAEEKQSLSKPVTSQNSNSTLVNSLAHAYKSRYQSVSSQSEESDSQFDNKSIKSLPPAYEDDKNSKQ